jgi:hypothetical protein
MKWFRTLTRRIVIISFIGLALITGGCLNITAQMTPETNSVQPLYEYSDCVPIIFGLAYGTASFDKAVRDGFPSIWNTSGAPPPAITRVRSVAIHDYMFLYFGARCVDVTGE